MMKIPEDMDIPKMRRDLTLTNLRWLARNLGVRNSCHPQFQEVMQNIREIIKVAERSQTA